MVDLVSLPFAKPTVFLLVSPYSTKQTMTVKVIVTLGLPRILRLFALLAFLTLAAIAVWLVLVLTLALSPALGDGPHVHRNWTWDHSVAIVMHGLTQFQPVGLLSTLDEQVHPNGLWRLLNHDGTQKVLWNRFQGLLFVLVNWDLPTQWACPRILKDWIRNRIWGFVWDSSNANRSSLVRNAAGGAGTLRNRYCLSLSARSSQLYQLSTLQAKSKPHCWLAVSQNQNRSR